MHISPNKSLKDLQFMWQFPYGVLHLYKYFQFLIFFVESVSRERRGKSGKKLKHKIEL